VALGQAFSACFGIFLSIFPSLPHVQVYIAVNKRQMGEDWEFSRKLPFFVNLGDWIGKYSRIVPLGRT
jgi:hypothetical protein